jgi:fatty-acyl-CoA synthase
MGFEVEHVFGITEVSGTPVSCEWQDEWDELPAAEQGNLRVRQGARAAMFEGLMVGDADTLEPVALDGRTAGELMLRGNTVMMGYFKNEASTRRALADGWFRTGDVAVLHDNGYVQITDRSKDVIISGGENISSVEVEDVIHGHPAVLHAAVVAQPDAKWGEVPCVFVELRAGVEQPSEKEIIDFCRARLAHFKCPRRVIFHTLPKTATGKIQKFRLREQAGSASAITHLAGRG